MIRKRQNLSRKTLEHLSTKDLYDIMNDNKYTDGTKWAVTQILRNREEFH